MDEVIKRLGDELSYRKTDRFIAKVKADSNTDTYNHVLSHSIKGTHAILFFPGSMFQITPYGMSWAVAYMRPGAPNENYLTIHPDLNEKFLRQVFTGFELLLYKICHIYFEGGKHSYKWETDKTRIRFKKILDLLNLEAGGSLQNLFEDIFFVRDSFAHSFIDIDRIKYKVVPLDRSFGITSVGGAYNDAEHLFMDDLNKLYKPVFDLFIKRQIEQIDGNKFASLCDDFLSERSLGP